MAQRIAIRRDTAANWALANPVLIDGEPGYDETNRWLKIGNGTTPWNSLPNQVGALDPDLDGHMASIISEVVSNDSQAAFDARYGVVFNVKRFGALGNGTTDDTAAIASCYAAARAFGTNAKVVFPSATYRVSAPFAAIDPTGTATDLYGSIIKPVNGVAAFNIFQATGGCIIRGGTLDLNKAATTGTPSTTVGVGIYVYNAAGFTGVLIEDMQIINAYGPGINLSTGSAATDAINSPSVISRINNVTFNNTRFGTYVYYCSDVKITKCHAVNTTADSYWDFMSARNTVHDCTAIGSVGHGVVTQYSEGFTASVCRVYSSGNHGIVVGGGDVPALAPAIHFTVIGCTVRNAAVHGITVDTTRAAALTTVVPTHGTITGNIVYGSGQHGIYLQNAQYGTCTGNDLHNNATSAIGLNSGDWTITGNTMVNNGSAIGHYGIDAAHGNNDTTGNKRIGNVDYFQSQSAFVNTVVERTGAGSPEGVVAAPVGSTYHNTSGGASTSLYVKTSGGITNTGWTAK